MAGFATYGTSVCDVISHFQLEHGLGFVNVSHSTESKRKTTLVLYALGLFPAK